jgi:hypothetical protein
MSQSHPVDALDLRADSYSNDSKNIVVSLATIHSPKRQTYSLPVTALYSFIADLQRLRPEATSEPPPPAVQPAVPKSVPEPMATSAATPDQFRVNITVPRRWIMRCGLPERPLVYLVFDPQTEQQAGYGLAGKSAREMAAVLLKYADVLERHEAGKTKSN